MELTDIDAPRHADQIQERMQQIEADETLVFESVHVTKEGREIPVEISASLITYQGESAILSVARDIRVDSRIGTGSTFTVILPKK